MDGNEGRWWTGEGQKTVAQAKTAGLHSGLHDGEPQTLEPLARSHPARVPAGHFVTVGGEGKAWWMCGFARDRSHNAACDTLFLWCHFAIS